MSHLFALVLAVPALIAAAKTAQSLDHWIAGRLRVRRRLREVSRGLWS